MISFASFRLLLLQPKVVSFRKIYFASFLFLSALWNPYSTGSGESLLGDLAADAVKKASKTEIAFVLKEVIFGEWIPRADPAEVGKVVRKGETLYTLSLTGMEIQKIIQRTLEEYGKKSNAFVHFTGMEVEVQEGNPKNLRIKVGIEPLMPHRIYTTCVHQMLLDAPYGYRWFKNRTLKAEPKPLNITLDEAVLQHLKEASVVVIPSKRIRFSSQQP